MVLVSCRPASRALSSKVKLNECSIPLENLRRSTKKCPEGQSIKLLKHGIKNIQGKQHGRRNFRTMENSSNMPAITVAVTCAATGTGSRHVENSEDLALPFSHCAIKNGQLLQEYPGTVAELLRAHPQGAPLVTRPLQMTARVDCSHEKLRKYISRESKYCLQAPPAFAPLFNSI